MILKLFLILIGFILLIKGADFLVDGSSSIAKKFNIPEIVIGLTIVSIGTSMPEFFVSIASSINGYEDMAMGNVIGSNLCNLLLILGISSTIRPIIFKRETKLIEIPLCVTITIIFMILCNINNGISKIDAIILLVMFVLFIIYTIVMSKKGNSFDKIENTYMEIDTNKKGIKSTIVNIIYILLGIIALKYGGDLVVNNSEIIAKNIGISEKIISLTIIALGTSLPELVTSVTASIKGESDIAIGNIIGSNIFNLLFIIGGTGILNNINYNSSYNLQMIILIISSIVLGIFPYTDKKDEMTRSNGITYLMLYALYLVILFIK